MRGRDGKSKAVAGTGHRPLRGEIRATYVAANWATSVPLLSTGCCDSKLGRLLR